MTTPAPTTYEDRCSACHQPVSRVKRKGIWDRFPNTKERYLLSFQGRFRTSCCNAKPVAEVAAPVAVKQEA